MTPQPNPAIEQALASVNAAAQHADADPLRPRFHFRPPANWMNDPNGTIYHNGVYHLFYQHNPYGDAWNHMHWGHATSRDLVHWIHEPIALWPSHEQGEAHCFSGCAAVDADGTPMLLYTSVGPGEHDQRPPNQQWAALGDAAWRTWRKDDANPIFSLETHGGPAFEGDWRDPYIFQWAGRTFLVLGGNHGDEAMVALYEAPGGNLHHWVFRKIIYRVPTGQTRFCECPNFFPLDDAWVLLLSPYRPVEYTIGDFDLDTYTFTPKTTGVLDPGFTTAGTPTSTTAHYYATNTLTDAAGRLVLLGWVRGFPPDKGWNGCLALPRILHVDADKQPRQTPHPALATLRRDHQAIPAQRAAAGRTQLVRAADTTFELALTLIPTRDAAFALDLCAADSTSPALSLHYAAGQMQVGDATLDWPAGADAPLALRLFVDRSVIELFSQDGRHAVTLVTPLPLGAVDLALHVHQGEVAVGEGDLWRMASIW